MPGYLGEEGRVRVAGVRRNGSGGGTALEGGGSPGLFTGRGSGVGVGRALGSWVKDRLTVLLQLLCVL